MNYEGLVNTPPIVVALTAAHSHRTRLALSRTTSYPGIFRVFSPNFTPRFIVSRNVNPLESLFYGHSAGSHSPVCLSLPLYVLRAELWPARGGGGGGKESPGIYRSYRLTSFIVSYTSETKWN